MTLKRSTVAVVGGRSEMATDDSAAADEDQIRALIDDRVKAVRAKDINGAMAGSASDILSFDVINPLQYVGLDALRKRLEGWFSSFQAPIGHEMCELKITAGDDVAFSHSLNRIIGTTTDGKKIDMYWRATSCYRKIDGKWMVTHEHNSVPFDPKSGKASLDLKPQHSAAWLEEMERRGVRKHGDRLRPATEAKTVSMRDGELVTQQRLLGRLSIRFLTMSYGWITTTQELGDLKGRIASLQVWEDGVTLDPKA